jgi:ornithine cyclodeaminase/alanine dehydrogenase
VTAIYLTEADVAKLVDVPTALIAVENAFANLAAQHAENSVRQRVRTPGLVLHSMAASAAYLGHVGWKTYTTTASGGQFLVGLYDAALGNLVALIEADHLGQLRTGATTAVAVKAMAPPDTKELGLFGAGWQAQGQLAAVANVCHLKTVYVYSRREEHRLDFARRMSSELNLDVRPVDRPREATEELPLVITATSSAQPVCDGREIEEGALVCAVGSNWPGRAEIDSYLVRRAGHVVCDSVDACRHEAGDLLLARESGDFDWSKAVNLADVVAGKEVGRSRHGGVSLFKSVGLAIEDVALASVVLERARAAGVGTPLPL